MTDHGQEEEEDERRRRRPRRPRRAIVVGVARGCHGQCDPVLFSLFFGGVLGYGVGRRWGPVRRYARSIHLILGGRGHPYYQT